MASSNEDLARAALAKKYELEKSVESLQDAHGIAAKSVAEVRERLGRSETLRDEFESGKLMNKIEEARAEKILMEFAPVGGDA